MKYLGSSLRLRTDSYRPKALVNYPISSYEVSETDTVHESSPVIQHANKHNTIIDVDPSNLAGNRIEDNVPIQRVRSNDSEASAGAGDRPRLSKSKRDTVEKVPSETKESKLIEEKLKAILSEPVKVKSPTIRLKLTPTVSTRSRLGKFIKGHQQLRFTRKRSKTAPLGTHLQPVDANVVPVFKLSCKRDNPKFKIVKHFGFKFLSESLSSVIFICHALSVFYYDDC